MGFRQISRTSRSSVPPVVGKLLRAGQIQARSQFVNEGYWSTVLSAHVRVPDGCFPATTAEPSRCKRDRKSLRAKSIYYVALIEKASWCMCGTTLSTTQTELYS